MSRMYSHIDTIKGISEKGEVALFYMNGRFKTMRLFDNKDAAAKKYKFDLIVHSNPEYLVGIYHATGKVTADDVSKYLQEDSEWVECE